MRSAIAIAIASAVFVLLGSTGTNAASLRVAPTTIDLVAPDSATTLTLRNEDSHSIDVQIRIFRWSQVGGAERLEPTTDVVASPPFTRLAPNSDYVVRIVRVTKAPVVGEESYRLLADELPDPSRHRPGAVNFILRYSIPVFFTSPDASSPDVSWNLQPGGNAVLLTAKNNGARHLRIADLKLTVAGDTIANRIGLVGYVLGRANMRWPMPSSGSSVSGHSVVLSAQSDSGAINELVSTQSHN